MNAKTYKKLTELINKMDDTHKYRLFMFLKNLVDPEVSQQGKKLIGELRETKFKEGFICPNCGSKHVVRFGTFTRAVSGISAKTAKKHLLI